MRVRGRRAVILAGITTGMVLVVGLLRWKDLLVRYYLIRLRADPDYLRTAILEPEESLARAGLRLYLTTEEGKDRLARKYLDACDYWCAGAEVFTESRREVIFLDGGHLVAWKDHRWWWDEVPRDNERDERDTFIRSCAPFLASLRGRSVRLERRPGFQYTFLTLEEAGSRMGWDMAKFWATWDPESDRKAITAFLIEPVTTSP